jgi:hypothetical protein
MHYGERTLAGFTRAAYRHKTDSEIFRWWAAAIGEPATSTVAVMSLLAFGSESLINGFALDIQKTIDGLAEGEYGRWLGDLSRSEAGNAVGLPSGPELSRRVTALIAPRLPEPDRRAARMATVAEPGVEHVVRRWAVEESLRLGAWHHTLCSAASEAYQSSHGGTFRLRRPRCIWTVRRGR